MYTRILQKDHTFSKREMSSRFFDIVLIIYEIKTYKKSFLDNMNIRDEHFSVVLEWHTTCTPGRGST